jgi:predicted GTPase
MNALQQLLRGRTREFYLLAIILWLLPFLALGALGLLYLWQQGWFWWFSGGVLLLTLASWCVRYLSSRPGEEVVEEVPHLNPRPDWSDQDNEVWRNALVHIDEAQLVTTPWQDITDAMLDQLTFVARAYHGNETDVEYAFSVPQLLLMLETWSRDYRDYVIVNVPFSQEVKISTVMSVSRTTDKLQRIYRYLSPVITGLRVLSNPTSGVMGQISSQLAASSLDELKSHVQHNMKVVLFEQVTQVAIDLYSGRLKFSDDELQAFRLAREKPQAVAVAPLSVMVIGQVNAGKSSLINALMRKCVAEIDVLPATAGFHHHHMLLAEDLEIYLIDTPGLDGSPATAKALLHEMVKADLLLWVSQANQPAKALDKQLIAQWQAFFDENLSRKKAPILLITTHNDRLPPAHDWDPPYDLENTEDKKVQSMLEALRYTHQSMGLGEDSPAVAVSLLEKHSFNLDVLQALLIAASDEARAAQLNRERLGAEDTRSVITRALSQSAGLIKFGVKLALK